MNPREHQVVCEMYDVVEKIEEIFNRRGGNGGNGGAVA